ncbi:unnamed protein product [Rhizoctonia solani]|uniref:Protein SYM1 n=1 Tax=Rhizoctonia solani TaxID=456999 RepID=A0A8H3CUG5_9AGAM|nr:unnamed protein product [Rhizoctonia solani]
MQAYMRLMNSRPLLGPCITTAFLFGTGDVVAQQAVDRKGLKGHDWLLDRLPVRSKPALVASRVALDQFAFAPIAVGLFFTCTGLMEGKSIEQVKKKLNSSYKDTLIANWTLFIPFQTINMFQAVIPLHHRLLAVNAISIPWNTFLSWKGATPAPKTLVAA